MGAFLIDDKEGFLELMQAHPDRLQFTKEEDF